MILIKVGLVLLSLTFFYLSADDIIGAVKVQKAGHCKWHEWVDWSLFNIYLVVALITLGMAIEL